MAELQSELATFEAYCETLYNSPHAAERAWFATATKQVAGDRFSLALDFGAWLSRLWPRVESAMDVSWDWRRTRAGDADGKVSWNMLIGW